MSYCELSAGILLACARVAEQNGSLPIVRELLSGTFPSPAALADYPESDVVAIRNNVHGYGAAPMGTGAGYGKIYRSLVDGRPVALSPCGRFCCDLSSYESTEADKLVAIWNQQQVAGC